ncbi:unnamed protein product [Orchesella dallaii]|uniref:C2H2-type domain-containing protein n=1 Tax=Orchesella dallaii TaxID=48710 RepID=A0ABP1RLH3_9HEXA
MPLLNSVCLFCYRDSSSLPFEVNGNSDAGLKGKGNLDKFVELAQRWLETNLPLHSNGNGGKEEEKQEPKAKEGFAACENCLFAVNSFCKLYHEWKCLELEVEWRLSKLCNVIKQADRVRSRKQRLETNFKGSEEGRKFIENVTKFRTEFKRKCAQSYLKSSPRVVLTRINGSRHTKTVTKQETPFNNVEHQILFDTSTQELCLAWISTFVAVLLLGNWDQESTGAIQNNCDLQIFDSDDAEVVAPQLKDERSEFPSPCEISSLSELEDEADCSPNQIVSLVTLENETKLDIGSDWRRFETDTPSFSPTLVNTKPKKRKYVQSPSGKPKRKLRRRELRKNSALFKCFRCNRNFTCLNHLHRHRRSFTHTSVMQNVITKRGGALRKGKSNLREFQITATSTSINDMNLGILRPLQMTYKQNVNQNDEDTDTDNRGRSFNEDEAGSSECEDGSSTESDSSSSSSEELSSDCSASSMPITKQTKRRPKFKKLEHSFVCSVSPCQESFKFEEELELHNKYHGCFLCSFCNETSNYAPDLARHELSHSEREIAGRNKERRDKNKKYYCSRCNYAAYGWQNYVNHHLTNHLNLPSQKSMCQICKEWLCKSGLKRHLFAYHKDSESRNKCNECSAYFDKPHQLYDHKRKKHFPIKKELLYFCDVESCKKVFSKEPDLKSHKRLHENCSICQRTLLAEKQDLHFQSHHDTSNVDPKEIKKCSKCPAYFLKEIQLRYHVKKLHPPPPKPFPCEMDSCSETFDFEEEFEAHKKQHGNFPCKYCSVVKTYAPNLAVHESSHSQRKGKSSIKWHCSRCEFRCRQKNRHVSHFLTRHFKLPQLIVCRICRKSVGKASLPKHIRLCHRSETEGLDPSLVQNCEQCPAYFLKKHQLTAHIKQIHDKKISATIPIPVNFQSSTKIQCDAPVKCQKLFKTMEQLENHRKLHGTFPCSTCNDVFEYAPKLALHEATHTSFLPGGFKTNFRRVKTFSCPACKIDIVGEPRYINHYLVTHMNLPPEGITCLNCGDSFQSHVKLAWHQSLYHKTDGENSTIAKCDQCSATFGTKFYLSLHKQKLHGEREIKFTCVDCGRKLCNARSLRKHRILVHKMREADFPIPCDVPGCERRFERELDLGWHKLNVHESKDKDKDNSWICQECGKIYSAKSTLTRHMQHHLTITPKKKFLKLYVCEKCGKVFKSQPRLDEHQWSHKDPESWKFSCLVCGKKSPTKTSLMNHIAIHTNEKPYICEFCGEEYAHGHNLRNHRNSKHNVNEYPKKRNIVNGYVSKKGQKLLPRIRLHK